MHYNFVQNVFCKHVYYNIFLLQFDKYVYLELL